MGFGLVKALGRWPLIVMLTTIAPLVRFWALDGLWQPVLVSGESMMPTLAGPLLHCRCQRCDIPLSATPRDEQNYGRLVCFNCGNRQPLPRHIVSMGQSVLIDHAANWFSEVKRFDLVAFTDARGHRTVKRVLGLPGESVGFDHGDLVIDQQRIARSLDQSLASAIDVYDDRFRNQQHSRWSSKGEWQSQANGFLLAGKPDQASDDDPEPDGNPSAVLVYCHQNPHNGNRPDWIADDYPGNQHVRRMMQPVSDLILHCRLSNAAPLEIEVWFYLAGRCAVARLSLGGGNDAEGAAIDITVAHLDGQVWTRITDCLGRSTTKVARAAAPSTEHSAATKIDSGTDRGLPDAPSWLTPERPIALVVRGSASPVAVSQLRLQRDLHWWHADQPEVWQASEPLGPDRYFVVGDNVPVSLDSRQQPDGLAIAKIIGRVVPLGTPTWPREIARLETKSE